MDLESGFALEVELFDIERSATAIEMERLREIEELWAKINSGLRYAQSLVDRTQPIIDRAGRQAARYREMPGGLGGNR